MGAGSSEDERSIATLVPEVTARIASLLLCTTFAWAALAKLLGYGRWTVILERYGLPSALRRVAAPGIPAGEAAIAVTGAFLTPRIGAAAALATLAVFSLAVLRARRINGDKLPCGCFGGSEERHYRTMILRNAFLAALAAAVLLGPRSLHPLDLSVPTIDDALPAALVVTGLALAAWTALQVSNALKRSR